MERAARAILRALCIALKWDVGILWLVDRQAGRLKYVRSWSRKASQQRLFARASPRFRFKSGEGLPGRVWRQGRPAWIEDISRDPNFPRIALARSSGLRSALAIPIRVRGKVQGVIEFVSRAKLLPHQELLLTIAGIGAQIGLFAARREAEAALEKSNAELRIANRRLRVLASKDALTGVCNRRTFLQRLHQICIEPRQGPGFCLAILDIDHFKRVNDRFGHQEGDALLRQIAETLRRNVRKGDLIARYGGEEFVLLFPGTGLERAAALADSLRLRIERLSGPWAPVTVSLGVAAHEESKPDLDEIVRVADAALYRAKRGGRNRVEVALPKV